MQIEIKKNKKFNEYTVKMTVGRGAMLALQRSLENSEQAGSPFSGDMLSLLKQAMESVGIKFAT